MRGSDDFTSAVMEASSILSPMVAFGVDGVDGVGAIVMSFTPL